MTEKNERHSYIGKGISREAFQVVAVKQTTDDGSLVWHLHAHSYDERRCTDKCQFVHKGIVATNVTQMDVANGSWRHLKWFLSGKSYPNCGAHRVWRSRTASNLIGTLI